MRQPPLIELGTALPWLVAVSVVCALMVALAAAESKRPSQNMSRRPRDAVILLAALAVFTATGPASTITAGRAIPADPARATGGRVTAGTSASLIPNFPSPPRALRSVGLVADLISPCRTTCIRPMPLSFLHAGERR